MNASAVCAMTVRDKEGRQWIIIAKLKNNRMGLLKHYYLPLLSFYQPRLSNFTKAKKVRTIINNGKSNTLRINKIACRHSGGRCFCTFVKEKAINTMIMYDCRKEFLE